MSNASDYFTYLERERVLVCHSCRYCLQPDGIERYLRTEHKVIPLTIRKELVNYSKRLALLDAMQVVIPSDIIPAFECLEIKNGFSCMICDGLYGTIESMRVHYGNKHGKAIKEGTYD